MKDRLTEKIAKNAKMVLKEDAEEEEEDHDYADRGNDGIDEEMGGRRRGNSSPMSTKSGASRKSHKSSKSSKSDHHIVADVTAGFVIFQYSESMARCLEDYASYDTFPMSLLTPSALKLRGHTIEVKQALQPDELIWENIEVQRLLKWKLKNYY